MTSHGVYYKLFFEHNEINKKVAINYNYNNNKLKSNQNQQTTIIGYRIHNKLTQ